MKWGETTLHPRHIINNISHRLVKSMMPEQCYLRMAETIRQARQDHKWSQRQLSAILGMSSSYVSHLEKGSIQPRLPTLRKISHALELNFTQLAILAGYIEPQSVGFSSSHNLDRVTQLGDLTREEWETVRDFLAYIRSKRSKHRRGTTG